MTVTAGEAFAIWRDHGRGVCGLMARDWDEATGIGEASTFGIRRHGHASVIVWNIAELCNLGQICRMLAAAAT